MSSRSAATLGQTRERVIILLVALSVLLIVQFFVYMLGSPDRIHLRGLPPVSASFAVLFLLIIYLQGSRRMTPWNAALLLIRGYTLGGAIAPFSGRLSDRMDARVIASIGLALQICGFLVYSTLGLTTPTFVVIVGAVLNGAGSSSFFPANNSAVMASAPARTYGVVSGLLRTFSNIGMVCSFVVALLITSLSIPRQTALDFPRCG